MTTSETSREVHPIYSFIVVGRENEVATDPTGDEWEYMSDDWIISVGNDCGSFLFHKFCDERPSLKEAEDYFFLSDECAPMREHWAEAAYAMGDAELMVSLRNERRMTDGPAPSYRLPHEFDERRVRRSTTAPSIDDDVRTRILVLLADGIRRALERHLQSRLRFGEAIQLHALRAFERSVQSVRAVLHAASQCCESEVSACAYANLVAREIDLQLVCASGEPETEELTRSLLQRAVSRVREELRFYTEVTVECFSTSVQEPGAKARASNAALVATADALLKFFGELRDDMPGLDEVGMAKLRSSLSVMGRFVTLTNTFLSARSGGSEDDQVELCRLLKMLWAKLLQGDEVRYWGWPGRNSVAFDAFERFCEEMGLDSGLLQAGFEKEHESNARQAIGVAI